MPVARGAGDRWLGRAEKQRYSDLSRRNGENRRRLCLETALFMIPSSAWNMSGMMGLNGAAELVCGVRIE